MRRYVILTVLLVLLLATTVQAGWSGSQSVTWERDPNDGVLRIYTSVLEYAVTPDWLVTLVADHHPIQGLDMDVSTTYYLKPGRQLLYTTVGVRRGVWNSQRDWTPYLTITLRL